MELRSRNIINIGIIFFIHYVSIIKICYNTKCFKFMRVFSLFSSCVDVFTSRAAVAAVAVLKSLPLASVYELYRTPDRASTFTGKT